MALFKRLTLMHELLLVVTGFLLGISVTMTFLGQSRLEVSRALIQQPPGGGVNGDPLQKQYLAPENDLLWSDHHQQDTKGIEKTPEVELDGKSLADVLKRKVRVLCWVMTSPDTIKSRARHVKATWGKRCNVLLFMSSSPNHKLPAIGLNVPEGRSFLWGKTRAALTHIAHNYIDKADWFLKADDDTYVIVENLRHMLMGYDPNRLYYFGRRWRSEVKQGYMSGGAGYVLSLGALVKLVEKAFPNRDICNDDQEGVEDVELGKCLENIGVPAMDSRDAEQRERFHPFDPMAMLIPGMIAKNNWYFQINYNPTKKGLDCCSDNTVTFHYVDPNWMYMLEYFVYHLHPFGVTHKGQSQCTDLLGNNTSKSLINQTASNIKPHS